MTEDSNNGKNRRSWIEEIEVAGEKLVEQVRKLAEEGNVRRIRVKTQDGGIAVDIPLTIGAIAGGAVVIAAPILAVLGALAAFVARLDIEITRDQPDEGEEVNTPED